MTKRDLRTGHVVELRGGDRYIVMKCSYIGRGALVRGNEHLNLSSYNDDLTMRDDGDFELNNRIYDIVAVFELNRSGDDRFTYLLRPYKSEQLIEESSIIVWERKEEWQE